jgi:hypothetical protein
MHQGEWYCTYSDNYTRLSFGKLEQGKLEHVWSTEGGSKGFCPVEVAIPFEADYFIGKDLETEVFWEMENGFFWEMENGSEYQNLRHADFGFYSGCVWGDDSDYKLKMFDLRELSSGKVTIIEEPIGYHVLPPSLKLRQCIDKFWIEDDGFLQFSAATVKVYRRNSHGGWQVF